MTATSILRREYDKLLAEMNGTGPAAFSNFVAGAYRLHREHGLLYPSIEDREPINSDFFVEFARRCGINASWLAQIMLGSWHKPCPKVVNSIGAGIGCCPEQLQRLHELVNCLECEKLPRESQVFGIYWDKALEPDVAERARRAVTWKPKAVEQQQTVGKRRSSKRQSDVSTTPTRTTAPMSPRRRPMSAEQRKQVSKQRSAYWDYVKGVRSAVVQFVNQEAPTSRILGNADPAMVVERRISEIARSSGVDIEILNNLWEREPNKLMRRRLLDAIRRGLHDLLPATELNELNLLAEQC